MVGQEDGSPKEPQIVLGVPGCWSSRTELLGSVAEKSGGYLLVGQVMVEVGAERGWEIDVQDHNPQFARAFQAGGRGTIGPPDLEAIARHTMTVYILGPGGSAIAARMIMGAAAGLLRAGGLAVSVESTGKSHSRANWLALSTEGGPSAVFQGFVTLIGAGDEVRSCGMQNLGLPDGCIPGPPTEEAANLLQTFLYYTLAEQPDLRSGQTFSAGPGEPVYRLALEPCRWYPEEDLFFNPGGVWRLNPSG